MKEKSTNKREWIKSAAIVFLTVMLVLTFFSQTIMNYSLPEVATNYVQSGTITTKVRGTGMVESTDPYNVIVKETRKVSGVAVKVGDRVEKGDVLLYLAEKESTELEAARQSLADAQDAYDKAFLSAEINEGIIQESKKDTPVAVYRQNITNLQNEVKAAEEEVKKAQATVDDWAKKADALQRQIMITPSNNADVTAETKAYNEAKTAYENASFALTDAQNKVSELQNRISVESTVSGNDVLVENLEAQLLEAQRVQNTAQNNANQTRLVMEQAQAALENKKASGDTSVILTNLNNQLSNVNAAKQNAENALSEKQKVYEEKGKKLNDYLSDINSAMNLGGLYDEVVKAKTQLEKLEAEVLGSTVESDISGTVMAINVSSGQETNPMDAAVVLQPDGQGYTMSMTVTNEQAKYLSVGDKASLVNSWWYNNLDITLRSIKPDKQEPAKKKLLTFGIQSEYGDSISSGQSLSISVGQKNISYDLTVPNSAIREDNNGKFILQIESKSTPLGNRYYASRVDVEVIASDETTSAIKAPLYGWEYVITTSTKPIVPGQQVRLND